MRAMFEEIYELVKIMFKEEKENHPRPACQLHMINELQLNKVLAIIAPIAIEIKNKYSHTAEWNFSHEYWFGRQFMDKFEQVIQAISFKEKKKLFLELNTIGANVDFFRWIKDGGVK